MSISFVRIESRNELIRVDEDGTVRAWDAVAGHYTLCHSLPAGCVRYCQARARRALKQWQDARAVRGVTIPDEIQA